MENGYEEVKTILSEHMNQLHLVAEYLFENEKITGANFKDLMEGKLSFVPENPYDPARFPKKPEETSLETKDVPEKEDSDGEETGESL